MSWRWQPPVLSPISPLSIVSGLAAASGITGPVSTDASRAILRGRFGAEEVVLTDSGTSALILALSAVIPRGGTVAYPGYACVDLTAAAVRAGIRVRLYDVDPMTLSPDLDSVRDVISRGVDAIVVAHLYGYPGDVKGVRELAAMHGIAVIEDAAQGAGGTLGGTPLGGLADISTLSFGRGKGTAAGGGGAVLVRTPLLSAWINRARDSLVSPSRGTRQVASLGAQWLFSHPMLYRIPASIPALRLGEMVYHHASEPRRIPASAAAILPMALEMNMREVARRRDKAAKLLSQMNGSTRLRAVRSIRDGDPGYLRLALIDSTGSATECPPIGALRGYPLTLEEHLQLRPILMAGERAGKGSVFLRDRLFTLPTHSRVGPTDLEALASWMKG